MRKDIILAMNLQVNFFSAQGTSYLGADAETRLESIREYLNRVDLDRYALLYSLDIRSPQDRFYETHKTQCIVGSPDVKLMPGLPKGQSGTIIAKRPSALHETPLLVYLSKFEPDRVVLIGAETNVGILFTAFDLRMKGFHVVVYEPLAASRDEYLHNSAISTLVDSLGVEIKGDYLV
jgi:nicotinamidase-related amidase